MIGAIASFSSMAVAGRQLSGNLDTFEIMFWRSCVGLIIVLTVASATGHLQDISRKRLGLHFLRNVSHFTGQNLWFFAVGYISFAELFALEFTTPLWAIVLAPLILGDKITARGLTTAVVGLIGILIVTRPTPDSLSWPLGAAALCAIAFAFTALFTRKLTRDIPITGILFWLALMQGIFGLVIAGYDGVIAVPQGDSLFWVVLVGFAGMIAHFCLTTALSIAPPTVVMPIDFARLPVIAIVGMVFFQEPLDWLVFLGAAIIMGANWYNLRPQN